MTPAPDPAVPRIVIDGGASGCRLAAFDGAGRRFATVRLDGHASLSLDAPEAAGHVLEGLARLSVEAGAEASSAAPLTLGLAGALRPERRAAFRAALPAALAGCTIVTDGHAQLLGATGGTPGACLAVGTGSVLHWQDAAGASGMAGGWGFPVGDEGSAAWLGVELLRRYLRARDRSCSFGDDLFDDVEAITGADVPALQGWTTSSRSTDLGRLATCVTAHAARGHPVAATLLDGAVACCLDLVEAAPAGLPLHLVGGLAPVYAPMLAARGVELTEPRGDALDGLHLLACGRA